MDHRSPLESIFGVIGGLPQGHDKPVKQAVYNAVALFLLFLCCAAALGLYMILEPFVKPLMWALLVGSALHPLKRSLRDRFQSWFQMLEDTNTPTVLGLVLLPVNIFNDVSECIGQFLWDRLKLILTIAVLIPVAILLYHFTPGMMVSLLWTGAVWCYRSLNFVIGNSTFPIVSVVCLGYLSLVFIFWSPDNNVHFHYASTLVWLLGSCCLASQFNSLQMPIFLILQVIFFGGFISEVYEAYSNMNAAGHKISFTELLSIAFHDRPIELDISDENDSEDKVEKQGVSQEKSSTPSVTFIEPTRDLPKGNGDGSAVAEAEDPWTLELFNENDKQTKQVESPEPATGVLITNHGIHWVQQTPSDAAKKPRPKFHRSLSQPQFASSRFRKSNLLSISRKISLRNSSQNLDSSSYESTFYLYSVMWCCIAMLFWKNITLLPLLPLPILYYVVKHTGNYLGVWSYLFDKICVVFDRMRDWCMERHDALVPVPIRGLYKVMHKVNATIKSSIKSSIDTVASCVVIFGLIVFLICASIFTALQIYAEGIMLVQMTSNVINQTVVQNPELRQLLPPTWDDTMDSILDNAYQYGREGISKACLSAFQVKSIMNDADSSQSEKLEKQVLELWDRIYQSWMTSNESNGPKVTEDAVLSSWDAFIKDIQKSPEIFNVNGIIDFAKQNVGTLMSLLESIWGIVISNISLIIGSFSTCLSIVLGGGTAVLNFILNLIVFLTTLFYLLNSSGDYYKPVELMTQFSPSGKRFGHALEAAINSVFSASFKMAAFYGMWTWFIHNAFNVQIVYLSSAFATILGAVPFLGTYWACVPGILDLWLSQDRWIAAILFAGFQFLPTSVVDTTIYKEIKGGHPYLTGLAIAGGIFCLGVEGAIIGPLLLCGLYVAIDLSSNLFRESPTDESINLGLHQIPNH